MKNDRAVVEIQWETLDSLLEGRSAIDSPRLFIDTVSDAEAFLACYGFGWNDPGARRRLEDLRVEAIDFIEGELLFGEPAPIPREVRDEPDVRRLLLWSSEPRRSVRQRWACTILRVMHTFAHCNSYFRDHYEPQIREQVAAAFAPHIHDGPEGRFLGTGVNAIPLAEFQMRGTKSRRSLALKLLQKPENVAADVFDWVGVRFVTMHRFDALLVARYLRAHNVINFANVRPGRSRNTLIDIARLKADMADLDGRVRAGRIANYQRLGMLRELVRGYELPQDTARTNNPFSSVEYHSIQLTVTQLIRVPNPYRGEIDAAMADVYDADPASHMALDALHARIGQLGEIRFFFPFEVQIIDREAYEAARSGLAAHDVYKERQRTAVRRRLWGESGRPA